MCSKLHVIALILATAALALTSPQPRAQPAANAAGEAAQPPSVRPSYALRKHHELRQVLDDMARTMVRMQEQTGKDEVLTPEARKDMASSMKKMSAMMHRISALLRRPLTNDAEATQQFEAMRKQMGQMEKAPPKSEPARPHPGAARSLRGEYEMGQLLRDMAGEMQRMQDQLNMGKLMPNMRIEFSSRMGQMSDMMRRLSGLTARSAMKDADMRRQLEKMQLQMGHMRDSPEMSATAGRGEPRRDPAAR